MHENPSTDWDALQLTREKLATQIGNHLEISLIDIGLDPQAPEEVEHPVIRVHVRRQWTQKRVPIPEEIDGIRVVVLPGDYRLT
jgi:hypothetical protein